MRIYCFDERSSRPIDELGSSFRLAPLTGLDDGARVVVQHLPADGRIGRHAAPVRRLLCVATGAAWVRAGNGEPYRLERGYAALWEADEVHEVWTDGEAMTAFVIEGDFGVPARLVRGIPIVIEDHDPAWRAWFEEVRDRVVPAFEGMPATVEHVGSTAVAGLAARPIVDVDVVVASPGRVKAAIERLATVGYRHRGDLGVPGREAFAAPPGLPRHELCVVVEKSDAHLDRILVRDHLRADPDDAAAYAAVKRNAAAEAVDDLDRYAAIKRDVLDALVRTARAEREPGEVD